MKKEKKHAFGKNIYLLGADKDGIKYWLESASWDCGWYWGFGYVETYTNNEKPEKSRDIESHQHFDELFLKKHIFDGFKELLTETPLENNEIWQLLELMETFYTLSKTADTYHIGGSNITRNILKDKIQSKEEVKRINEKLIPAICEEVYKILSPEKEN